MRDEGAKRVSVARIAEVEDDVAYGHRRPDVGSEPGSLKIELEVVHDKDDGSELLLDERFQQRLIHGRDLVTAKSKRTHMPHFACRHVGPCRRPGVPQREL